MPPSSSRSSTDARSRAAAEIFPSDPGRTTLMFGATRVALLPGEFIRRIHFAIVEDYGDNAQDVLYRSGFEWALQTMLALNPRPAPPPDDPGVAKGGEIGSALEAWWSPFAQLGWGGCSFAPLAGKPGVTQVDLQQSAIAEVLDGADNPVCHVYAGLFAGALSFIERVERHAVELQCRAVGAAACRFLVAPAAKVDAVETWRQQGVAPAEIIKRLV